MIPPTHPLFRAITKLTFSGDEHNALAAATGRPVAAEGLQAALEVAATRGWAPAMKAIVAQAEGAKTELDFGSALVSAAREGQVAAMREVKSLGTSYDWTYVIVWWGSTEIERALIWAARGGHVGAMRLAKEWGATSYDMALAYAARSGCVEAMRLAKGWGAKDFDKALLHAAEEGQVVAMREAQAMGATDFEHALALAAGGGHIEAMRLAWEWGSKNFDEALSRTEGYSNIKEMQVARRLLEEWKQSAV
jgi:hypothetical protein